MLTAQVLTEQYFGSADAMLRLDMSEYMERHSVAKLIGAPPGLFQIACVFQYIVTLHLWSDLLSQAPESGLQHSHGLG